MYLSMEEKVENRKFLIKSSNKEKRKRSMVIDLLKTIFVLGMVFSHMLYFFVDINDTTIFISTYINLVSFSGFLFCFGYNAYNAYINNDNNKTRFKLLKNILKLFIAFWISGMIFDYFIAKNYDVINYIKIIFLLRLPGYSEFLATFVVLNLFMFIFLKPLKIICKKNIFIVLFIILSLGLAMLPVINTHIPWVDLLIKTDNSYFPLLPYLSLFFMGIYCTKNKLSFKTSIFLITLICFGIYIFADSNNIVTRFPLHVTYILGSYMFIYLYYCISRYIGIKFRKVKWLKYISFIGRNSLEFLVISNVIIFLATNIYREKFLFSMPDTLISFIIILLVCYIISYIKIKIIEYYKFFVNRYFDIIK